MKTSQDEVQIDKTGPPRLRYDVWGSEEELQQAWEDYREEYPCMLYSTHIRHREPGYIVIVRFRTRQECREACVHNPKTDPLSITPSYTDGHSGSIAQ